MKTFHRAREPLDAAAIAEKAILVAYAEGVVPRAAAMQQLGLCWYGDLLQKMNAHGIRRPSVSTADMLVMRQSADEVLALLDDRGHDRLA